MSTYVITGGANGIGLAAADILKARGDTVHVIDREGGDIVADLGSAAGREFAVRRVYELCPDGIDGLACVAGISTPKPDNGSILSINYFGTLAIANGLFPLLEKRLGSCVITSSASITWVRPGLGGHIAELLCDCGDEERILALANSFPADSPYNMYTSSKIALARWARRVSIEWAIRGVRINVLAPGCVATRLGQIPAGTDVNESFHFTIPPYYKSGGIIPPADMGQACVFLLDEGSRGFNGSVLFADAGQEAFYNTDKIYF